MGKKTIVLLDVDGVFYGGDKEKGIKKGRATTYIIWALENRLKWFGWSEEKILAEGMNGVMDVLRRMEKEGERKAKEFLEMKELYEKEYGKIASLVGFADFLTALRKFPSKEEPFFPDAKWTKATKNRGVIFNPGWGFDSKEVKRGWIPYGVVQEAVRDAKKTSLMNPHTLEKVLGVNLRDENVKVVVWSDAPIVFLVEMFRQSNIPVDWVIGVSNWISRQKHPYEDERPKELLEPEEMEELWNAMKWYVNDTDLALVDFRMDVNKTNALVENLGGIAGSVAEIGQIIVLEDSEKNIKKVVEALGKVEGLNARVKTILVEDGRGKVKEVREFEV